MPETAAAVLCKPIGADQMNHYFYSQSQNRTVAVRLNGIQYKYSPDYERIPATAQLRGMAERGSIPTFLPQVWQDKTTGYKNYFFAQL